MIKLSTKQLGRIKAHAIEYYPREICGVIVKGEFIPLANISENPEKNFAIDESTLFNYLGEIDALVHSHCYDSCRPCLFDVRTPSLLDMQKQKETGVPWLIFGTEGVGITPPIQIPREPSKEYEGRPFIWFVDDCYTLVQDYYQYELNITLPDHPLEDDYVNMEDFSCVIEKHIKSLDFQLTSDVDNIKNGDLLLLNNGIGRRNHIGVFHDHQVIHQEEISVTQDFAHFIGRIEGVLKYAG